MHLLFVLFYAYHTLNVGLWEGVVNALMLYECMPMVMNPVGFCWAVAMANANACASTFEDDV